MSTGSEMIPCLLGMYNRVVVLVELTSSFAACLKRDTVSPGTDVCRMS